jgi:hypothetical protein
VRGAVSQVAGKLTVEKFKFSMIWVESNAYLMGDPSPVPAPMGFLGERTSYSCKFDQLQHAKPKPIEPRQPWDNPKGQLFWKYYLEKDDLSTLEGSKAWRFLIPFREKVPINVTMPGLEANTVAEMFLYPYGMGLVITITCEKRMGLTQLVEHAYSLKKNDKFIAQWDTGSTENVRMSGLAEACFKYIRKILTGSDTPNGNVGITPFTVFTVIKGRGVDSTSSLADFGEEHRILEAVTEWPPLWEKAFLLPLNSGRIPIASYSPASHILYGRKRGRAIWFPAAFTERRRESCSLSCYHRNIVLASLQVESLCSLATMTAHELKNGNSNTLRIMHRECARLAVGILGRMYGGNDNTYRSMSAKYQIQQNRYDTDINLVRNHFNMVDLNSSK